MPRNGEAPQPDTGTGKSQGRASAPADGAHQTEAQRERPELEREPAGGHSGAAEEERPRRPA